MFTHDGVETVLTTYPGPAPVDATWTADSRYAIVLLHLERFNLGFDLSKYANGGCQVLIYDTTTSELRYCLPIADIISVLEQESALSGFDALDSPNNVSLLGGTEITLEYSVWLDDRPTATLDINYNFLTDTITASSSRMQ